MTKFERQHLIEELTKPQSPDGLGLGIASIGTLAIGAMAGHVVVIPIIGAFLTVAGPVCLAASALGLSTMLAIKIFKK